MKYILITGGVMSGVGKGIIASSLGVILKSHGIRVSAIKIDPYLNIDAGTFSPYEHGEVFVLDDGGEVDLDLGNYERFLGITLHRDNNITTGKIYKHVIDRERAGDYLGKTVQSKIPNVLSKNTNCIFTLAVPHITDAIQEWVERVAKMPVNPSNEVRETPELGGTVGDIEGGPFFEAFRQLQLRLKPENFMNVHVSYVIEIYDEQKTKPTQNSVRELRGLGLFPSLLVCRSETRVTPEVRMKLANFCQVDASEVINVYHVDSIYRVPLMLAEQGAFNHIQKRLQLQIPPKYPGLAKWQKLADRFQSVSEEVRITLVGKYVQLGFEKIFKDAYASVIKALEHSATACNRKLVLNFVNAINLEESMKNTDMKKYQHAWDTVHKCDGIIVPGGFGERGIEGKISAAGWARLNGKPFLGVCLGMQCAVIEFARSELGWDKANSTEFDPHTAYPVIVDMPEHNPGQMGGTMRLGLRKTQFVSVASKLRQLYGNASSIEERHRHRYEVNPALVDQLEEKGLRFVGRDAEGEPRMEICEILNHPYFVGVQFHPEYLSRPLKPSPCYLGLILASTGQLDQVLKDGRIPSPLTIIEQSEKMMESAAAEKGLCALSLNGHEMNGLDKNEIYLKI